MLISTDKAVHPGNVMGATKRAAEVVVQELNARGPTRFVTVRFGNVLDSAGSVVPLFREQIQAGGPVTVTDPEVTRYFMTIPEACQLIMQASASGQGGQVFVLDMGEPIKISYLAEQMIRLSGKRPGDDIRIEYIGLRPGEKLHERLFLDQEHLQPTAHEKLLLAQPVALFRTDSVALYVPAAAAPGTVITIGLAPNAVHDTSEKPCPSAVASKLMLYWFGLPDVPLYVRFALVAPAHTLGFDPSVIVGSALIVTVKLCALLGHPLDPFRT